MVGEGFGKLQNFGTNLGRFKALLSHSQEGSNRQPKERQLFQLGVLGYKFGLKKHILDIKPVLANHFLTKTCLWGQILSNNCNIRANKISRNANFLYFCTPLFTDSVNTAG
jgi:hypothetical protein